MTDSITLETVSEIARRTFGEKTRVSCMRQIAPSTSHGITETPPSTRNLLYVVELDGHDPAYVFRFSRVDDDVYDQEVRNYQLLSDATGIRVPTIYELDTSKSFVPTSYMVMDYLAGKHWQYHAHPDNPATEAAEKAQISEMVGCFYARVHAHTRRVEPPELELHTLGYSMDRLEEAVRIGNVKATLDDVDRCRRAVEAEPAFQSDLLRLCVADTEIHVVRDEDTWRLSFACDAEWVEFRHPYADLAQRLEGPLPWWKVEKPSTRMDPSAVEQLAFFKGYRSVHDVDVDDLLYHGVYFQLALWSYVAMNSRSPEKRSWLREAKGPLIDELVQIVSSRAPSYVAAT